MRTIHNIVLNQMPNLSIQGGPAYNVTEVSGQINLNDEFPLWDYTCRYIREEGAFAPFVNFFHGRRGPAFGFYYKDWLGDDWHDAGQGRVEMIGGVLRLVKNYPDDINPNKRIITRPLEGTVVLAGGGAVDHATGIVTGGTPNTAATFQFVVPVAFVERRLTWTRTPDGISEVASVTMRELRIY